MMLRRLPPYVFLPLLAVAFVALVFASSLLLRGARLDLTANHLYTLSPGTERILAANREPIKLKLYASDAAMRDLPTLRAYSRRVRELLEDIAARSHGTITLETIDPLPYSEAEDGASAAGLQAVPVGAGGQSVFFGLVGTNTRGGQVTEPFFDPTKEVFLEYDIARLLVSLSGGHKPVLAVLSGLPSGPTFDPQSGQVHDGWAIDTELAKSYELRRLQPGPTSIGQDVDLLLLIHPKNLSDDTQYAIDQFVLRGGRLLVFVDPLAETDPGAQNTPQLGLGGTLTPSVSSVPERLFKAWGIAFDPRKVVRDPQDALQIQNDPRVRPVANPVMLGLTKDSLSQDDTVSAELESLNLSTAGALELAPGSPMTMLPIARTSTDADLVETDRVRLQSDASQLSEGFHATGKSYVLAARFTGKPDSAFPERAGGKHLAHANAPVNIIVVADTDVMTDRLWVHSQDFFGRKLFDAFAKNGDFIANAVDNLAGTQDLIGLRARPGFRRPFTRVEKLRQRADQSLRGKQDELQAQLKELETHLVEMHATPGDARASARQTAEVLEYGRRRQAVRSELRQVQAQLNASIDRLGATLKLIDILAVPLLLTLGVFGALLVGWLRRRQRA